MRKFLLLLIALLLASQAMARTFPPDTRFAKINEIGPKAIRIGFTGLYTAPGLRVFNEKNALIFLHQLPTEVFTGYQLDGRGQVIHIWVLTPAEIAERKLDVSTSVVTTD